jgi:GNAT superfamily N-acetyltransferase
VRTVRAARSNAVVTIREAVADDAAGIADVQVRSWLAAYRGLIDQGFLDRLSCAEHLSMWQHRFEAEDPDLHVLVAEAGDEVVGFSSFGPSKDDDAGVSTAEVYALYLAPEWFGAGVGRRLIARVVEALGGLGFRDSTLWVLELNDRARRFYEVAGWRWDGARSVHPYGALTEPILRYRRALA